MDSSSEDFEDLNCIEEGDLDTLDDISDGGPKKPHFLDYDATPPTGEELQFSCYSSLPEAANHANDLDKNNANEKSAEGTIATNNVPAMGRSSSGADEVRPPSNSILLTRRRSATEVPGAQQNTGTRKKEFSSLVNSTAGSETTGGGAYHSLDYESVPILQRNDNGSSSSSNNRHIALERDLVIEGGTRRPVTTTTTSTAMSTSMSSYLEHGNVSLRNPPSSNGVGGGGGTWPDAHNKHNPARRTVHEMGPKVECVYSLLSMLGSRDIKVTSGKFLELSKSPETCTTLRRSGCIPLFVQMIHSDSDEVSRKNAAQALHNVVHCHPDDKVGRRESKVLKLIETVMAYCEYLKRDMHKSLGIAGAATEDDLPSPSTAGTITTITTTGGGDRDRDRHPSQAIFSLMKISFDEEHRHAMCQLGALQAIAQLVHLDHAVHGMQPKDSRCVSLRRYAGMALTNLTFGDGNNKALLCSNKEFMRALVAQLNSLADDLIQVTASVLRNLSWRADNNMITVLNEIGTVTALTYAAMKNNNMENTLKAILSALWNLSAHCSANKAEFCRVVGALAFLVEMLTYDAPSKTLTIVENAGGILRNVSSHIAVREDYRQILRERDCLGILLQQLRSESLTIVSNACGTLWNLSARCATDQKYLWENGAVPMLRSLIHSKHKMISNGSNAALKNLLNYRPGNINHVPLDSVTKAMNLKELPSLSIRKQRALEQELDRKLSDTCEIIDMTMSPKRDKSTERKTGGGNLMRDRSESVEEEEEEDSESAVVESGPNKKKDHQLPSAERQVANAKELIKDKTEEDEKMKVEEIGNVEQETTDDAPVSMNVAPPASIGERPQQETEFDQITDYSLRYEQDEEEDEEASDQFNGNEIILILEDTVKCYEEEGTPYTISNATSMTDLRRESNERRVKVVDPPRQQQQQQRKSLTQQAMNSGLQTPEKPFKYAEEGTPGCFSTEFSRIGSLSSLEGDNSPSKAENAKSTEQEKKKKKKEETEVKDGGEKKAESEPLPENNATTEANQDGEESEAKPSVERSTTPPLPVPSAVKAVVGTPTTVTKASQGSEAAPNEVPSAAAPPTAPPKSVSFIDYAQETPLMFSRTSSLESLSSAEPACVDDVSSVVSESSRIASGIMSPSELPDSPTQSVPQSPSKRRRAVGQQQPPGRLPPPSQGTARGVRHSGVGQAAAQQPQSVFEDKLDRFDVENTPAQFSCATSLSNLSILNDDQEVAQEDKENSSSPFTKKPTESIATTTTTAVESGPLPKIPDNHNNEEESDSSAGDDEGDDELLDTCVSMGLHRRTKGDLNPDFMRHYYTEDTPAHLSKAASNSDLSVLSMLDNVNQCEVVHDDSSSSDAGGNDDDDEKLLQECIANGIENTISKAAAETSGPAGGKGANSNNSAVPPMRPAKPKPMSVNNMQPRRGDSLSSLSIDSAEDDVDILEQAIAAGMNRVVRKPEFIVGASSATVTQRGAPVAAQRTTGNDSLSSLDSCESNEQSNLLFEQCMQSGLEKRSGSAAGSTSTLTAVAPMRPQKPRSMPRGQQQQVQRPRAAPRHVEYHRTDDEALLMECINMGIEKNVAKGGTVPAAANHRGESARPQPSQQSRYEFRENINSENILARQNQDIMRRIERMTLEEKFGQNTVSGSKNANGASVDTQKSCAGAVPGTLPTGQDTQQGAEERQQQRRITGDGELQEGEAAELSSGISSSSINSSRQNCLDEGITDAPRNGQRSQEEGEEEQVAAAAAVAVECTTETGTRQEGIINSINGFDDGRDALGLSNEYPALNTASATEQSLRGMVARSNGSGGGGGQMTVMDASNEYMMDSVNKREVLSTSSSAGGGGGVAVEKHKDPDLMLRSVDRLTHVLVTTAEYLRAHDVSAASELMVVEAKRAMEGSCEGSTWNDNTCPNGDVSFPSLSYSPPKIEEEKVGAGEGEGEEQEEEDYDENTITASLSLNKITEPTASGAAVIGVDGKRGTVTVAAAAVSLLSQQQNSKSACGEQKTDTVKMDDPEAAPKPAIHFEIGGQVKTSAVVRDPFQFAGSITSLDLDDIQPPSEMEGISYSNYNTNNMMASGKLTDSPQLSSMRNRKAGLPSTLVARRAIAGPNSTTSSSHGHSLLLMKSVESVASHTNLENIGPPSLMDELLDSMMSVDSITSEVASDPLARTLCGHVEMSNYETALSDNEDTMTLRSCHELPLDGNGSSSNCSSNQSTPVRKRPGSVTAKMKREMDRERFKTYTVDATIVTGPSMGHQTGVQVVPTAASGDSPSPEEKVNGRGPRVTAKQRRQENRSRFQTQILDYSEMKIFEIAPKEEDLQEDQEEPEQQLPNGDVVEMGEEVTTEPELIVTEKRATVLKKTLLRLIKPTSSASPEDTNKSVRGRRKPEYVSPYRRPAGAATPPATTPGTPASINAKGGAKSLIATPGNQRKSLSSTGFISKLKQVATKKSPTKTVAAKAEKCPKELNRQGTFTKEEPSSENLPKVSSLPATPTRRLSKLPLVGNGSVGGSVMARKSYAGTGAGTPSLVCNNNSNGGTLRNGGVIKRQISAPATAGSLLSGEKRKSMIGTPSSAASRSSIGQLSERSTSSVSIKSNVSVTKTPNNKGQERKLPLSMPASRSNSTMGTPRTPTTPSGATAASKISLYGRAKGLIPVTSSSARK